MAEGQVHPYRELVIDKNTAGGTLAVTVEIEWLTLNQNKRATDWVLSFNLTRDSNPCIGGFCDEITCMSAIIPEPYFDGNIQAQKRYKLLSDDDRKIFVFTESGDAV